MREADYSDIMDRERPEHHGDRFFYRHPNMPIGQRAKIFAPYDALAGFSGAVKAKEVPYEPKRVMDADELWELNRRLNLLHALTRNRRAARANHPAVCVEHFVLCDDPHHDGYKTLGRYATLRGAVGRVDPVAQLLWVENRPIAFDDIYSITDPEGRLFRRREGAECR